MHDDEGEDWCDDDEAERPALGPLGNAIVATVVGGLILIAITRVILPRPRVVVRQVRPPPLLTAAAA